MPDRPNRNVVTRFAPSPTGYLHVGGARTALFNWAYARRHGGTFILRIEDTDAARSTAESTRRIIEDLVWLGLEWDEGPSADALKSPDGDVYSLASQRGGHGPYFQSQRNHLYTEYLARLVKIGRAYRCFKSQEQLKAERDAQKAAGAPMKYDPTEALNRSDAEQKSLITAGKPFVWRFRMPDADVTVADMVLGDVTIKAAELEDFVIIKAAPPGSASSNDISAAGGPTFHFANVVDDATMEVTHVLRAQEHLMNTPKHVAMFDALGIARPKYAHMPLIFNPDGTKMSKRDKAKTARAAAQAWEKQPGNTREQLITDSVAHHAAISKLAKEPSPLVSVRLVRDFLDKKNDDAETAQLLAYHLSKPLPEIDVHDFRSSGYLASVLLNYIALLGWNPGGNVPERFDLQWFVQNFSIDGIGKSNAKFDRVKLLAFNGESLAKLPPDEFRRLLRDALQPDHRFALILRDDARFALFAECYRARSQTLTAPATMGRFFVLADHEIEFDPKAVAKVLTANDGAGKKSLQELVPVLEAVDPWTSEGIHKAVEKFAADTKRGMGDVAQPIRVAVSGTTVSPPIHDTLAILGKQSTINRLNRAAAL